MIAIVVIGSQFLTPKLIPVSVSSAGITLDIMFFIPIV